MIPPQNQQSTCCHSPSRHGSRSVRSTSTFVLPTTPLHGTTGLSSRRGTFPLSRGRQRLLASERGHPRMSLSSCRPAEFPRRTKNTGPVPGCPRTGTTLGGPPTPLAGPAKPRFGPSPDQTRGGPTAAAHTSRRGGADIDHYGFWTEFPELVCVCVLRFIVPKEAGRDFPLCHRGPPCRVVTEGTENAW